jgi:5-methylthioadenosine/S-adenosylhomocysteine deaminase
MCQICDVAASGADGARQFAAAFAANSGLRHAAAAGPVATHGPATAAMPEGVGVKGRRTLIKGGTVLSMDERVGNCAVGDVLVDGSKIAEVAARIDAPAPRSSTRPDIS